MAGGKGKWQYHLPGGGMNMDDKTNFVVYCIEEYKAAKGLDGKGVIELFNRYHVIDYIRDHRKDIDSIRIDTHENNSAMQHLIDKMNFTKVGELHGVYRPDEISYVYENVRE